MQTLGLGFTWEELSPGQRFRTLNRTITETDLVLFTGVTGMLEIIFTDRTFAAEKGAIQGQFVPAALTYSLIEGLLCQSMIQGTGLAMLELNQQILAPVRWAATMRYIAAAGAAPFVDCGPGATLASLLKRIAPQASVVRLDEDAT